MKRRPNSKNFGTEPRRLKADHGDGTPPTTLHLFPFGMFLGHPVGAFEVTELAVQQMIANFSKFDIDVVVDFDHATEEWSSVGDTAKAAGWIKKIWREDDGLYGEVEWNADAAEAIAAGEWRYISPSWWTDAQDPVTGDAIGWRLVSVGLVNRPYFDELGAIAKDKGVDEMTLDPKTIEALGLNADATDEQINEALTKRLESDSQDDVAKTLGFESFDAMKEKLAAESTDEPTNEPTVDETKIVSDEVASMFDLEPGATVSDVRAAKLKLQIGDDNVAQRLAKLEEDRANERVDVLIAKAKEDGKITPATEKDFRILAKSNPEQVEKLLASAPRVVDLDNHNTNDPTSNGAETYVLSAKDKKVAASLGHDLEVHAKHSAKIEDVKAGKR